MSEKQPTLTVVSAPSESARNFPRDIPTDLVDEVALAVRLGVSRSTLQSWRYAGRGPRYLKIGRLIRYRNADIEAFLRASTREVAA
jgi:predicted DNA-binding transcriptional regulator AlpA